MKPRNRLAQSTGSSFEVALRRLIKKRQGAEVAELLLQDPQSRYSIALNRCAHAADRVAGGNHAEHAEATYRKPLQVLARMVDDGSIHTVAQLFDMMCRVTGMTARHYRVKAQLSDNPRIRVRGVRQSGLASSAGLPLFQQLELDVDRLAGRTNSPSYDMERADLLRVMLAEGRWLGTLRLQVLREARAFHWREGTTYGAFRFVARLAVLDAGGQIVKVRHSGRFEPSREEPLPATVRRIRRLYREAATYLQNRAFFLGYHVKPLV